MLNTSIKFLNIAFLFSAQNLFGSISGFPSVEILPLFIYLLFLRAYQAF